MIVLLLNLGEKGLKKPEFIMSDFKLGLKCQEEFSCIYSVMINNQQFHWVNTERKN